MSLDKWIDEGCPYKAILSPDLSGIDAIALHIFSMGLAQLSSSSTRGDTLLQVTSLSMEINTKGSGAVSQQS